MNVEIVAVGAEPNSAPVSVPAGSTSETRATEPEPEAARETESVSERAEPQAASGPEAKSCNVAGDLIAALQVDDAVIGGLSVLPDEAVSVANAFLLWDGAWLHSPNGDETLDPLRDVIQGRLRQSAPHCLAERVEGPRFLILTTQAHTTVVVLGSGSWTWSDLLGASDP